jgi:hypothetical protein
MSNVASLAERFISETMVEHGVKKPDARKIVAREIGVKPGALERFIGNRLVHIERIETAVKLYVVRRLETQIARLESDLRIARLNVPSNSNPDLLRAQEALDEARKALGK